MNKEETIKRIDSYFENISGEELLQKMKEHGFDEIPTVLHVTADEKRQQVVTTLEEGVKI